MKDRENKKVEVRTKSGEKFATEHGFNAIKDGIKQSRAIEADIDRKPPWLRVKLGAGPKYKEVKNLVTKHRLSTVCEESHCPNRRMLESRDGYSHAHGLHMHESLQILLSRYRQSKWLARHL